jgi:hypothetical protein
MARVVYNIPVFQCTNQKCGLYYMDPEGEKQFEILEKALKKEIKTRRRV